MDWIKKNVNQYVNKRLTGKENLQLTLANPTENDKIILDKSPGGWSIDRAVSEALMTLVVDHKIRNVVEIGAGYSTIIFHYILQKQNPEFSVCSVEENSDWFKIPTELEKYVDINRIDFNIGKIHFKLSFFGIHANYRIQNRRGLKHGIELVFVDGPQYYYGREGGLDYIYDKLKTGSLIILDDAERYTELCVIYKWLKVYKGLELIYLNNKFGDKGFAVLKVSESLTRRFSFDAFCLGMMQGVRRLFNLKSIIEKQEKLKSSISN